MTIQLGQKNPHLVEDSHSFPAAAILSVNIRQLQLNKGIQITFGDTIISDFIQSLKM